MREHLLLLVLLLNGRATHRLNIAPAGLPLFQILFSASDEIGDNFRHGFSADKRLVWRKDYTLRMRSRMFWVIRCAQALGPWGSV